MNQKTIALVGAYERDNFGDLLFALVTKNYLSDYNVVLTSPLPGTVDNLLGSKVHNYREYFLSDEPIDAIWTVGGHVGGARPASPYSNYPVKLPINIQDIESPYMPRPSRYHKLLSVPSVLNSISLGGVLRVDETIRAYSKAAATEADIISVRDRASSETLESWGLPYLGSPDLIHTLPLWLRRNSKTNEVILQFSESFFKPEELTKVADWLTSDPNIVGSPIVLFLAGIAPNHDSQETYDQLIKLVLEKKPETQISITQERDPLKLAARISAAKIWIGTSLHGRIISCAYSVPRISWDRWKLSSYCNVWDSHMPHDATLENIENRVAEALTQTNDRVGRVDLRRADQNMKHLITHLEDEFEAPIQSRIKRRLRAVNTLQKELAQIQNR